MCLVARVLYVSDLHCPNEHPKALDHLKKIRNKFKCDRIVFLGDELDAAAFSKYPLNPDMPNAGEELELAIKHLKPFYKEFPEAKVLSSNHGERIFKKCLVSGLPSAVIRRYAEILQYPVGWELVEETEIDEVLAMHGDPFNKSSWRIAHEKVKQSIVMGHIHSSAGIFYSQLRKKKLLCANFGCLIDVRRMAFDYGKKCIEKPCIGSGVVIDGEEAHFIPMGADWL
jgi:UDP-2,3-diacylglucosamine pyrophosphatase LpxH